MKEPAKQWKGGKGRTPRDIAGRIADVGANAVRPRSHVEGETLQDNWNNLRQASGKEQSSPGQLCQREAGAVPHVRVRAISKELDGVANDVVTQVLRQPLCDPANTFRCRPPDNCALVAETL